MNLDETTLLEIEDYIEKLDEDFGLKPNTLSDIELAIRKQRKANKDKTSNESESLCGCGKPMKAGYAPCCSYECWTAKFEPQS